MACGCGETRSETMTTNMAQALLDQQEAQQREQEAMIASAARASGNADSNSTAQRFAA